ncbi:MAG: hypothetical protein HOQ17_08330 [Gemmatimonadaceae bacterium]|nr:hypothetical protein [Gemmatimonadaceae bacterium]
MKLRAGSCIALALAGIACGDSAGRAPRDTSTVSAAVATPAAPQVVPAATPPAAAVSGQPVRVGPYCSSDSEELALQCADGSVVRHDDSLVVQTASGPLALVNVDGRDDDQQTSRYTYVGTLRSRGVHHVIGHDGYEVAELSLYSGSSGRAVAIASAPVVGPDGRYFATAELGLNVCEANTSNLEIWRLTDSVAVREWNVEPWDCGKEKGWGPSNPVWASADTLRFTRVEPSADDAPGRAQGERSERRAMVVRRGARWALVDPAP